MVGTPAFHLGPEVTPGGGGHSSEQSGRLAGEVLDPVGLGRGPLATVCVLAPRGAQLGHPLLSAPQAGSRPLWPVCEDGSGSVGPESPGQARRVPRPPLVRTNIRADAGLPAWAWHPGALEATPSLPHSPCPPHVVSGGHAGFSWHQVLFLVGEGCGNRCGLGGQDTRKALTGCEDGVSQGPGWAPEGQGHHLRRGG